MEDSITEDKKFCECGCGQEVKNRFIHGHNRMWKSGRNNPSWKGGKQITSKGYIVIRKPEHPYCRADGTVFEHRLVMESYLGRYLDPDEEIHHINEVKTDNRIENLKLFQSHKEHIHFQYVRGRDEWRCYTCGNDTWVKRSTGKSVWYKHPILKNKHVCGYCYQKYKRKLRKSI